MIVNVGYVDTFYAFDELEIAQSGVKVFENILQG